MSTQEFIKLAREKGLMTIQKDYGIVAGEYSLMYEDHRGNRYEEPKLFKGNEEVTQ